MAMAMCSGTRGSAALTRLMRPSVFSEEEKDKRLLATPALRQSVRREPGESDEGQRRRNTGEPRGVNRNPPRTDPPPPPPPPTREHDTFQGK
ncbi:hypothetical protein EYF80_046479 [Liparis tanakae]|uniref:Uncharacterized protein n=1 Tax=Liparis tanakae TaxID=230148 RepID=A0A4Z2FRB6_9TELE|nr:hypothetical protein EYF80_046479 [Liparis tanakae]